MGSDRAAAARGAAKAQRRGRPRVPDRAALTGILFVLKSDIPWEMLPQEMGLGSGMSCWRRLEEWQEAGVWERLHRTLLDRLGQADEIDWERASLDSASVAAPGESKDRSESDGTRQTGLEAPCYGRPKGRPARGDPDRRQRARLQGAGGGRGCRLADPQASRPTAQAPEEAARGQGLRLPPVPQGAQEEGHHPSHRSAWDRVERKAGPTPVGSGADFVSWLNRFRRLKVR